MASATRVLTIGLAVSLLLVGSATTAARTTVGSWEETRFTTGCEPGPFHAAPPPEHRETHYPPLDNSAEPALLDVDVDPPVAHQSEILGSGFNFEHALWSCPEFRGIFRSEILDPFRPAIARVDTGLLPAAPSELPARDLGPAVYQSVLSSAPYADSWRFFHRLNRAGVRIVLGIWGGPAQFTRDGSRRGELEPSHYDDYVDYVATVIEFIVRHQQIPVWATTIANEPDGGDGNQIPPDGLAYIAHQLAPRLAAMGVKLYGPDTANGEHALSYLPLLLDDPVIADNMAFIGFHQYYPSPEVGQVVDYARSRRPDLPVIITEYTSFGFGDLDDGQEANAQNGFTLDIAATVLSHYRNGVDAALYWDAIDYLQPGHDAITRWGFLRGPGEDFRRRQRYYGMQQILAYLQPGASVLEDRQTGANSLQSLSIRTADGVPVVFLVNQDFGPLDLTLRLIGAEANRYSSLVVTRTDRTRRAERLGRLNLEDSVGQLTLPPRSITTLSPAGAGALPDDSAD
jgi:O-glycosyl hydrolase